MVHLAVPVDYVEPITRLIAELDRHHDLQPPPDRRVQPPADRGTGEWPSDDLRRFALGRSRTHRTISAVMDLLADRPDQFHPVAGIAAELDMDLPQVIGALAGLTRLVKAHHDYATLGLPVLREQARERGQTVKVRIAMTSEQACRWKAVRDLPQG